MLEFGEVLEQTYRQDSDQYAPACLTITSMEIKDLLDDPQQQRGLLERTQRRIESIESP